MGYQRLYKIRWISDIATWVLVSIAWWGSNAVAQDLEGLWVFHTGKGFSSVEFVDAENGRLREINSQCVIAFDNPYCKEKVYAYRHDEVERYIQLSKRLYEERVNTHTSNLALGSSIVVISLRAAYSGLAAPDPTMLSKVFAGASVFAASIAGIVVVVEGWQLTQLFAKIKTIDDFFSEQASYLSRCGHVRKDFITEARHLGISFIFAENGGRFIPGDVFLAAKDSEQQLLQDTIAYANENGVPIRRAYKDFFIHQCGHVAKIYPDDVLRRLSAEAIVPQPLVERALQVSQKLSLKGSIEIEFSGFQARQLKSSDALASISRLFTQMEADLEWVERFGSTTDKNQLKKLQMTLKRIVIKKQRPSDQTTNYQLQKELGQGTLLLYFTEFNQGKNALSWHRFLADEYNLRFLSWQKNDKNKG